SVEYVDSIIDADNPIYVPLRWIQPVLKTPWPGYNRPAAPRGSRMSQPRRTSRQNPGPRCLDPLAKVELKDQTSLTERKPQVFNASALVRSLFLA
ncbi:MAG: hypothetical protein QOD67_5153, partial [Caballeronia sp.]|nr:hypothetical protein [Caballeronia sp.]